MAIIRTKFNISVLGEGDVGKTTLVSVYSGKEFDFNTLKTVGIDNYFFNQKFDGHEYKFKVFDTAGQERYKSISNSTIRLADGFLLVFSVDKKKSFELINEWLNTISSNCDISRKVIFLVGNKIDIKEREVSNEEAVTYAKTKNLIYNETSAKTGFGVKETFQKLFYTLYQKCKEIDNDNEPNNINSENKQTAPIQLDKKQFEKTEHKKRRC